MLNSGDVVALDLGTPRGSEAGARHPGIVTTAQRILDAPPSVLRLVPLTSAARGFSSEVEIEPDDRNGLGHMSVAQCQHIRTVSADRVEQVVGNVGPVLLSQIRGTLGLILDIPY